MRERKQDLGYRCGSHAERACWWTDEAHFRQFYEMDFCIISVLNLELSSRIFSIDSSHKGKKEGMGRALCFEWGNNWNKCFSFTPGLAAFIEYLRCNAAHPAACLSLHFVLSSERQRCGCISISGPTTPSKQTSIWVCLSSSSYPSFLPGSLLFLSLSSLLWLSLLPPPPPLWF